VVLYLLEAVGAISDILVSQTDNSDLLDWNFLAVDGSSEEGVGVDGLLLGSRNFLSNWDAGRLDLSPCHLLRRKL